MTRRSRVRCQKEDSSRIYGARTGYIRLAGEPTFNRVRGTFVILPPSLFWALKSVPDLRLSRVLAGAVVFVTYDVHLQGAETCHTKATLEREFLS